MKRRRLLTLGRLTVWMHPATLLFAGYMLVTGHGRMLLAGMASILLHEAAHGAVARALGAIPQEVEITPLGVLLRLEDDERMPPLRRLAVLAAGPAMTLLICHGALAATRWGFIAPDAGRMLFASNAAILMMNLLPSPPLDGGRMLALALGLRLPAQRVHAVMRGLGTAVGVALIGANVYLCVTCGGWNLSLSLAGCFLIYSASSAATTSAMHEWRGLIDRKILLERRGVLPCRWITADRGCSLRRAVQQLSPDSRCMLLVSDARGYRIVSEEEIIAAYMTMPGVTVGEAADVAAAKGGGVIIHCA